MINKQLLHPIFCPNFSVIQVRTQYIGKYTL